MIDPFIRFWPSSEVVYRLTAAKNNIIDLDDFALVFWSRFNIFIQKALAFIFYTRALTASVSERNDE
jgi:hypothetical protein